MFTYSFGNSLYQFISRVKRILFFAQAKKESAVVTSLTSDVTSQAEWIMNTFGNQILRYAYSFMKNMDDAEDILQETLIAYIDKAPAFESDDHAKAWLLTVAANKAKNKIKYNTLRQHDELNEELTGYVDNDMSFLWEAVSKLPDDYREVIHLFYEEDYPTAKIAEVLNRKESTVRSQLKRGRDMLKNLLKEEYDFGE